MANFHDFYREHQSVFPTLPFNPLGNGIPYTEFTVSAVKRSLRRWQWFDRAQESNPSLGTLSYLPVEIRWMIWRRLTGKELWRWLTERPPFSYRPRRFGDPAPIWLRKLYSAIPLVGLEIDEMYLATTTLHFDSAENVAYFWDLKLAPWLMPWLRRLSFSLDSSDRSPSWLQCLQGDLAPNISAITLDHEHVDHYLSFADYEIAMNPEGKHFHQNCPWMSSRYQWHRHEHLSPHHKRLHRASYERYDAEIGKACSGLECRSGLKRNNKTNNNARCKHAEKLRFFANKMERDLTLFDVIANALARKFPNATIQLASRNPDCPKCHQKCKEIIQGIET